MNKHLPSCQGYADDSQFYLAFNPNDDTSIVDATSAIENCVADARRWFLTNNLKLNDAKTQLIVIGLKRQLSKLPDITGRVGTAVIRTVDHVRNLGVLFDINLSLDLHIANAC